MLLQDVAFVVAVEIAIVELAVLQVLLLAAAGNSHTLLLGYGGFSDERLNALQDEGLNEK